MVFCVGWGQKVIAFDYILERKIILVLLSSQEVVLYFSAVLKRKNCSRQSTHSLNT